MLFKHAQYRDIPLFLLVVLCFLLSTMLYSKTASSETIPALTEDCYITSSGYYSPNEKYCSPSLDEAIQFLDEWTDAITGSCEPTPSEGFGWDVRMLYYGSTNCTGKTNEFFHRLKKYHCDDGYKLNTYNQCVGPTDVGEHTAELPAEKIILGPCEGNPCNPLSGNKHQKEIDYIGQGPNALKFGRTYNSQLDTTNKVGNKWQHSYMGHINPIMRQRYKTLTLGNSPIYGTSAKACVQGWNAIKSDSESHGGSDSIATWDGQRCAISKNGQTVTHLAVFGSPDNVLLLGRSPVIGWDIVRASGESLRFIKDPVTGDISSDDNSSATLSFNGETGFVFTDSKNTIEKYNGLGQLLSITKPNGDVTILTYDTSKQLTSVSNQSGDVLQFSYDTEKRLKYLTLPDSRQIKYEYDATGNLGRITYPGERHRIYHYEDTRHASALTGITDERGVRYATWSYDDQGRALSSEHANAIDKVSIEYLNAFYTRVTTESGSKKVYYMTRINGGLVPTHVTYFDSTANANLYIGNNGQCVVCDKEENYEYGSRGLVTAKTKFGVRYEYGDHDEYGNPAYVIEAAGTSNSHRRDFTYDAVFKNKISTITEPSVCPTSNKVTSYTYDDSGSRTSARVDGFKPNCTSVSKTTSFEYNGPDNQLTKIDGPRTDVSDTTILDYYPDDVAQGFNRSRLQRMTLANGTLIKDNIQYSTTGKISSEQRANNLSLTYGYYADTDKLETLVESNGEQARTTRWTYLPTGEVSSVTTGYGSALAQTITLTYDNARRLVRVQDNYENVIEYELNGDSTVKSQKQFDAKGALKRTLARVFDTYGNLDAELKENEVERFNFTIDAKLLSTQDGNASVTTYSYDDLKRLSTITSNTNGTDITTTNTLTSYGYDVNGRLTKVTDPKGNQTTHVYDDLGNLLTQSSPDTGLTQYSYDAAGNLLSKQNAVGHVVTYSYDNLNRVKTIDYPGQDEDVTYIYDVGANCNNSVGRVCRIVQPTQELSYHYSGFGEIVSQTRTDGTTVYTTAYTYDLLGQLTSLTTPSGRTISYLKDGKGRTNQIASQLNGLDVNLINDIQYDVDGQITKIHYANNFIAHSLYDLAGRLYTKTMPGLNTPITIPPTENVAPYANAGYDLRAIEGMSISLDASGSLDVDGQIVTYQWQQISGPSATMTDSAIITPSVTLPSLESDQTLVFQLTVTDNIGSTATDTVTVNVVASLPTERTLFKTDFTFDESLAFDIVDEGSISGPSNWDVVNGAFVQSSNIYSTACSIDEVGTMAIYDQNPEPYQDFRVITTIRSQDDDDIGVVIRYVDKNNYYRFSWNAQTGYRRLIKRVNGEAVLLASESVGYTPGVDYQVEMRVQQDNIWVLIDGEHVFAVKDNSLSEGSFGFYMNGNQGGYFDNLLVEDLSIQGNFQASIIPDAVTLVRGETTTLQANVVNAQSPMSIEWQVKPTLGTLSSLSGDATVLTPLRFTASGQSEIPVTLKVNDGFNSVWKLVKLYSEEVKSQIYLNDFSNTDLSEWQVIDEGNTDGPSSWAVTDGWLTQASNIHTPDTGIAKRGTVLMYTQGYQWSNYRVDVNTRSDDNDSYGVVFRAQDASNYYRLAWDKQRNSIRVVKRSNDLYTTLASAAYPANPGTNLTILANGNHIVVFQRGVRILETIDLNSPYMTGTIGLYSWENAGTSFDDVSVKALNTQNPNYNGFYNFASTSLADWTVVNTPGLNTPSKWVVESGRVRQKNNSYNYSGNAHMGTYLRNNPSMSWQDYELRFHMRSTDNDTIGFMFRIQDDKNFYRFDWNLQSNYSRILKFVNGVGTTLITTASSYNQNSFHNIVGRFHGSRLQIVVDNVVVFDIEDSTFSQGGYALFNYANAISEYDDIFTKPITSIPNKHTRILNDTFSSLSCMWQVVNTGSAGNWGKYGAMLRQRNNVGGTYIKRNFTGLWKNYAFEADILPYDNDTHGMVFYYQDKNNYYWLRFNNQSGFTQLLSRVNGVNKTLAYTKSWKYTPNRKHKVRVEKLDNEIRVYIEGKLWLTALDDNLSQGTIGFMSDWQSDVRFDNARVYNLTSSQLLLASNDEAPSTSSPETQYASLDKEATMVVVSPALANLKQALPWVSLHSGKQKKGWVNALGNLDKKALPANVVQFNADALQLTQLTDDTVRQRNIRNTNIFTQGNFKKVNHTTEHDTDVQNWVHFYDANGQLSTQYQNSQWRNYAYDALDRLTLDQPLTGENVNTYAYDRNSNRTQRGQDGVSSTNGLEPTSNRLLSDSDGNIIHNAAGYRLSDKNNTRTFTYNNANRLYQVIDNGNVVATYYYNALGQRSRKVTTAETIDYHYDVNGQLIAETTGSGEAIRDYVYLNNQPVAMVTAGQTEAAYYIHTDHLGTPRAVTDDNLQVVWQWMGEAFGDTAANDDPDGDGTPFTFNHRFAGQSYDAETGLHYNYFRYYDPSTGRYITSDPIGLEGGLNTYGYVHNNPLSYIDPKGLSAGGVATAGVTAFCTRYPMKCVSGLFSLCRLLGGCEIPDGMMNEDVSDEEGKNCPVDLPDKIPDFDFDDPTKPPVDTDGNEWPWKGKLPQGGEKGGYKNPNGPESLHPDLDHGGDIGSHWDFNDRKGPGYRVGPDGKIYPK